MEHNPPPNIAEDYKVWAKLSVDGKEFSVPCKIFLPKTILEKPQVYIYPERQQFNILPRIMHTCHLTATIGEPPEIEILCKDTHISGGSMRHWEDGLEEGYLKVYPTILYIINYHKNHGEGTVLFRLTPSLHLSPWDSREYHFEGEAKIRHGKRFRFKLKDDFNIIFLNHYKWQEIENKRIITFSELVAEAKLKRHENEDDIEDYLSIFDDFLLLVSFAEGQRCMIPQLNISLPEKFIDIYRLDRSLPHISSKHNFNDFIIDTKHLEEFLTNAWKIFNKSNQYELIKAALEINTNDVQKTMESEFLSLFSSVETLILAFRLENKREYIVKDPSDWKAFNNKLKEFVKSYDLFKENKDEKALIYQNISGLNRVPLQYAFKKFVSQKNLDFNDLWPFSNDQGDWSLTTIRNRLVHGYRLDERYIDSFGQALRNLDYYAKRLLLTSLGWGFDKSKLFRRDDSDIKAWQEAREIIRDWK